MATLQLAAELLAELLSGGHAFLQDAALPLYEFLAGRAAIECDDLVELGRGEIARVDRRDRIEQLVHARVHAFEQFGNERIIVALDLRPVLHDPGFKAFMSDGMSALN